MSSERQDGGCSVEYYKRMKDDVGDIWEFSYLTLGTQHRGRRCRLLLNAYQAFSAHIVLGWWSFQEPLLRIFNGEIEERPSILLILQIRTDFQRERPNSLLVAHTNSSIWNFSTNSEEKTKRSRLQVVGLDQNQVMRLSSMQSQMQGRQDGGWCGFTRVDAPRNTCFSGTLGLWEGIHPGRSLLWKLQTWPNLRPVLRSLAMSSPSLASEQVTFGVNLLPIGSGGLGRAPRLGGRPEIWSIDKKMGPEKFGICPLKRTDVRESWN